MVLYYVLILLSPAAGTSRKNSVKTDNVAQPSAPDYVLSDTYTSSVCFKCVLNAAFVPVTMTEMVKSDDCNHSPVS